MYCPRCGDVLKTSESGEVFCERGQMSLSQHLYQRLAECYVENLRRPKDVVFIHKGKPHSVGSPWYCPGCGIEIHESSPGTLVCAKCTRSIVEFVRELVELAPHLRESP